MTHYGVRYWRVASPQKPPAFLNDGTVFEAPIVVAATVAAAMIDGLVHHAEVPNLKGDSYRLKDRDLGRVPNENAA